MSYAVLPYCDDEMMDKIEKFVSDKKHVHFNGLLLFVDDEVEAFLLVKKLYAEFGNFGFVNIIRGEFTDASYERLN